MSGILDTISALLFPQFWRKDEPTANAPIKYEAQFGFDEKPRPLKVIRATKEEMDSANLELEARDFCAHIQIEWRGCLRAHAPFWYQCKGLENELRQCYWEEKLHDMKEFEREKRLNARERKLRESTAS